MKFKKIEKAEFTGCMECSPVPPTELPMSTEIDITDMEFTMFFYVGDLRLYNFEIANTVGKDTCTLKELVNAYAQVIGRTDALLITNDSALHSETYEYCKVDNKFYLVKQGNGYA